MNRRRTTVDSDRAERRARARGYGRAVGDPLYSILRFIARHVRGFWGALAAFLTVGLATGIIAAALFGAVTGIVQGGLTQHFDQRVLRWLATHRTPSFDEYMIEISAIGSGVAPFLLVLIACVYLWLSRHRWSVYILIMSVLGGQVVSRVLKIMIDRDRPGVVPWLEHVDSASFPSGHAMTSTVVYGSVAYVVGRLVPTRRMRIFTWCTAALIIVAVGISRMYLGVHYPSDVIGGFLAGAAWLAFVVASTRAVRFFAPRRPATAREEPEIVHPPDPSP